MNVEVRIDGVVLVKMEVNPAGLSNLLRGSALGVESHTIPKSTPVTKAQIEELLSRIDARSARFLKQIGVNNGTITWGEMRAIFDIKDEDDWSSFSAGYGKGITRALRHILKDKSARLVWWIDSEWNENDDWDPCKVYVDGAALQALRQASGVQL
jgi:hypothetical protein